MNNTTHVVLDVSWVDEHQTGASNTYLFNRVPIRNILELIAIETTNDTDADSAIWQLIEGCYKDHELNDMDFNWIALVIELLKEQFYSLVDNRLSGTTTCFVFDKWIDHNTMLLKREDL